MSSQKQKSKKRILTLIAVAVVAGGAWFGLSRLGRATPAAAQDSADTSDGEQVSERTSAIEIKTLSRKQEFNADLGFGKTRDLFAQVEGTLTWVPDLGQEIKPGEKIWEIDRQPVIYMPGDLPMYRDLYKGVKKGDDILQLEEFLIAEGFGPDGWLADNSFNARTRAAVKAFQKARGMTEDGLLGPAELVVGQVSLRVETRANLGDLTSSGPVLTVTDADAIVTLTSSSRQLANFQQNPEVVIVLGDSTELPATLDRVKSTPADETGAFGYEIRYLVDAEISDAQPVKVKLVQVLAANALTVPVDALIALAEGGYAVEVKTGVGNVLRGVDVIDFDDTTVAVTGDVVEGDQVVIPS